MIDDGVGRRLEFLGGGLEKGGALCYHYLSNEAPLSGSPNLPTVQFLSFAAPGLGFKISCALG